MDPLLPFRRNCPKTDTRCTDGQEMRWMRRTSLTAMLMVAGDLHPDVLWNTAC